MAGDVATAVAAQRRRLDRHHGEAGLGGAQLEMAAAMGPAQAVAQHDVAAEFVVGDRLGGEGEEGTGPRHPSRRDEDRREITEIAEDVAGGDQIEARGGALRHGGDDVADLERVVEAAGPSPGDHRRGEVDTIEAIDAGADHRRQQTGATAEIEGGGEATLAGMGVEQAGDQLRPAITERGDEARLVTIGIAVEEIADMGRRRRGRWRRGAEAGEAQAGAERVLAIETQRLAIGVDGGGAQIARYGGGGVLGGGLAELGESEPAGGPAGHPFERLLDQFGRRQRFATGGIVAGQLEPSIGDEITGGEHTGGERRHEDVPTTGNDARTCVGSRRRSRGDASTLGGGRAIPSPTRPSETPPMDQNALARFTGGSPLRTLVWLVVLSLVVGFVLETIGLDPFTFVRRLIGNFDRFVDWVLHLGVDAVTSLLRYLVWGAVIVVPVWLVLRIAGARR